MKELFPDTDDQVCRAEEEREGAGRGMFSRRQVEEGDLPLSWVQVRERTYVIRDRLGTATPHPLAPPIAA